MQKYKKAKLFWKLFKHVNYLLEYYFVKNKIFKTKEFNCN